MSYRKTEKKKNIYKTSLYDGICSRSESQPVLGLKND